LDVDTIFGDLGVFIILEMGFATTDLDNFKILEDIPSFPVAFFIPILLISCFIKGN
jgi:hypothetical protein